MGIRKFMTAVETWKRKVRRARFAYGLRLRGYSYREIAKYLPNYMYKDKALSVERVRQICLIGQRQFKKDKKYG